MITIVNGTVLKGVNLTPSNENILIDEGKIVEISPSVYEGEIIDASDCIILPSFLNAHTHIGDSIIKDEGDGLSLSEIVKPPNGIKHVALENASKEDIIFSMKDSLNLMLESGTTHFIDYREGSIEGIKLLKEASKDIPIKPIILARDDSFYDDEPDLSKVKHNVSRLLKYADGIAPSGFGEISLDVAEIIVNECNKKSKISSIHVAESVNAQDKSFKKYGKSEIKLGIDYNFNQLVHLTNPFNSDFNYFSNGNFNITLCPRANAAFGVGIPPLYKFLKIGLKPLIGSDNIMINTPNIFRELEFTFKIMKAKTNNYIDPLEILKLATTNICVEGNNSILNNIVKKTYIKENNTAQLMVVNKHSRNNKLSIINRTETKDIKYIFNEDLIFTN